MLNADTNLVNKTKSKILNFNNILRNLEINSIHENQIFQIFDQSGKNVMTIDTKNGFVYNIQYLSKGVYFIQNGQQRERFVKK
jgi:hypothetical protein